MDLLREVHGQGPLGGICFVGEAPSVEEIKQKVPFCGPSGRVLRNHITAAGLRVSDIRLENVIERKLENNDCTPLYLASGLPGPELAAWWEDLRIRLTSIKPKVIVACGDTALRAVTQKLDYKIGDVQCYCLRSVDGIPVIPVYHPAFIFRQPDWGHWLTWGIHKATKVASGQLITQPNFRIKPTFEEALYWLNNASVEDRVAIDIEKTRDTHEITCFSVATSATEVMSIPFAQQGLEPYWSPAEEAEIWTSFSALLAANNKKIFQNFIFDTMCLGQLGLYTKGAIYDTLVVANLLQPELPKGLADLARLHCYCEPWKKAHDFSLSGDVEAFWRYNAEDAARTFEIALSQERELKERHFETFYQKHIRPLYHLTLNTCLRGIRIDNDRLGNIARQLRETVAPLESRLAEIGNPLVPPHVKRTKKRNKESDVKDETGKIITKGYKTVETQEPQTFNPRSPLQIKQVLDVLGYRIPTKHGSETTSREALLKLNRKQPHELLGLLLAYSQQHKLLSTYGNIVLDEDRRCRFSYNIGGTKSGRFSASSTPWDTGLNIQTIPRKTKDINLRSCFIPDPGMTFVQVDLSQAELRVVAWLAGEETLIRLMENGEDIHAYTAKKVEEATKLGCPRQLGKRLNHAANYGMGPEKFADSCLMEADIVLTVNDARKLMEARSRTFPRIAQWQSQIADTLHRTRKLCSPHGRERHFFGQLTDATVREALSFIPQATVVDTLNQGWIAITLDSGYDKDFNMLVQGHDSLLFQVRDECVNYLVALIKQTFSNQGVVINGIWRSIPFDITQGPSWGELNVVI